MTATDGRNYQSVLRCMHLLRKIYVGKISSNISVELYFYEQIEIGNLCPLTGNQPAPIMTAFRRNAEWPHIGRQTT
jgi:hypothetical protein